MTVCIIVARVSSIMSIEVKQKKVAKMASFVTFDWIPSLLDAFYALQ